MQPFRPKQVRQVGVIMSKSLPFLNKDLLFDYSVKILVK